MNDVSIITSQNSSKRKYWLDALRGMAMIFVIFGHQCPEWTIFFVFTSSIKVSMFFVLSGYLFNERNGQTTAFLKNIFWKLFIPYFFLSLLPVKFAYALVRGRGVDAYLRYIYDFFCGTQIWYMPCCIIAEIIHFLLRKYLKKPYVRFSAFGVMTVLGLSLAKMGIGNFAFINTACTAQGFLALGFWIKEKEEKITLKRKEVLPIGAALYLGSAILSLILYPGESIDIKQNIYYNYLICAIMIIVGSVICFVSARWIDEKWGVKRTNWIVFVGQNTLVFYILHHYVKYGFNIILNRLHIVLPAGPAYWFINSIAICIGCSAAAILINRFFPFMVGKKRLPANGK